MSRLFVSIVVALVALSATYLRSVDASGLNYTCMVQSQGIPWEQATLIGHCVGNAGKAVNLNGVTPCLKAAQPPLSKTQKKPVKQVLKCMKKYAQLMGNTLFKSPSIAVNVTNAQTLDDDVESCLGNNPAIASCPFSQFTAQMSTEPKILKLLNANEKKLTKCYPYLVCTVLSTTTTVASTAAATSATTTTGATTAGTATTAATTSLGTSATTTPSSG